MLIRLLFATIAVLTLVGPLPARADATSDLKQLFEDDWEFNLKENPTFASYQGDRRYDARLSTVSEADEQRRASQDVDFLKRLSEIDRRIRMLSKRLDELTVVRVAPENPDRIYFGDALGFQQGGYLALNQPDPFHPGLAGLPFIGMLNGQFQFIHHRKHLDQQSTVGLSLQTNPIILGSLAEIA